jgi:hypothetical protein
MNANGQQVRLVGLDVHDVYIGNLITVHDYINKMNYESKTHKIREEIELTPRKVGKPKVESRCIYNPDGTIKYKVDYGWKGGDSSCVFYTYDSIGRLINAINYNSIFGKNHNGSLISFKYNSDNQIVSCISENQITNFSYYPNGNKESVEIVKFTQLCYPSIRNPKHHVYDTTSALYFYEYDKLDNLNCILNEKNDTLISFSYDENQNLITVISRKSFKTNYVYEYGVMIKSSEYEIEYPSNDLKLFESCDYTYINNHLDKCTCKTEIEYMDNYSIQYIYNEKDLLVEKIRMNEKGKIDSRTIYTYEYY